jgi:nitrogen fixation/metabolism regulation signal transduction histidine kinase
VTVSIELREGLPQLFGNRVQLEEMFVNLIMNVIEAMNSVTDRARLLRISSDIIHVTSSVQVTVEDAGMGIGKDKERIFEPFFTTKSEGTGLGLAICRAIVEAHGGSLHASANKPYGMIFHVALPTGGVMDLTRPDIPYLPHRNLWRQTLPDPGHAIDAGRGETGPAARRTPFPRIPELGCETT